ncbi:RHS repeat domain-containing protein, partial [Chitinophaga ginsengisegetis]|uniref:RHS repeat domain-containing protein n=1 Tax=Chitinophaga ginsengisegetis TaxID=393003 RepID=UPI000DB933CA
YRYGFNGKENDNEIKGEGNEIDYGMRVYDPRIGKFLSTDPLSKQYPHYTPYQFAGNTPIQAIDLDGAEEYHFTYIKGKDGSTSLRYLGKADIKDRVFVGYTFVHGAFYDTPTPVYETRVNQRQAFIIHDTYREPIDRHGGLDASQPQEWKDFDVRTTYGSFEDFSDRKNGSRSLADMASIGVAKYNASIGPENAAMPAGGAGNKLIREKEYETFFRAMSPEDYKILTKTGMLRATSETFISPTLKYASKYDGILVEFKLNKGTTEDLLKIGVRDLTQPAKKGIGHLPGLEKGTWKLNNAFFKVEKGQINIGLGQGEGLKTFNLNIQRFNKVKR